MVDMRSSRIFQHRLSDFAVNGLDAYDAIGNSEAKSGRFDDVANSALV